MSSTDDYLKTKLLNWLDFMDQWLKDAPDRPQPEIKKLMSRVKDPALAHFIGRNTNPKYISHDVENIRSQLLSGDLLEAERGRANFERTREYIALLLDQKNLKAGIGTRRGGRKGAEATHGDRVARIYPEYIASYEKFRRQGLSKTEAKDKAAHLHKTSARTIQKAVTGH